MFYKRGEVISDKFGHLKEIGFRVSVFLFWRKKRGKRDYGVSLCYGINPWYGVDYD